MKVQGTQEVKPLELEIGKTTVYIRKNIEKKVNDENREYWEYDEEQYSLNDYFKKAIPENLKETDNAIAELMMLFEEYMSSVETRLTLLENK